MENEYYDKSYIGTSKNEQICGVMSHKCFEMPSSLNKGQLWRMWDCPLANLPLWHMWGQQWLPRTSARLACISLDWKPVHDTDKQLYIQCCLETSLSNATLDLHFLVKTAHLGGKSVFECTASSYQLFSAMLATMHEHSLLHAAEAWQGVGVTLI